MARPTSPIDCTASRCDARLPCKLAYCARRVSFARDTSRLSKPRCPIAAYDYFSNYLILALAYCPDRDYSLITELNLTGHDMLIKDAISIAGPLGYPSKMPGTSYGISAKACITGAKLNLVEGSTCHGCYALKGNYIYPSVKMAHEKRLAGIASPQWVSAMVTMLKNAHKPRAVGLQLSKHHRWHDSGDIQSEEHLAKICEVAAQTPELAHWLPTREIGILTRFIKNGGKVPGNLTIRVSATMIDGNATKAWPTTSTVHDKAQAIGHVCPAPKQNNNCGDCRACWALDVFNVSYHKH